MPGGKRPAKVSGKKRKAPITATEGYQPETFDVDQLLDFDPAGASLPAVADPVQRSSGSTGKAKLKEKSKGSDPKPAALASAAKPPQPAKRAKRATGASSQAATDSGDGGAEQLEPTIRQHRAELEALAQRDPEFYAYLKETDEDLLAFGVGEAESSDNDEGLAQELEDEDGEDGAEAAAAGVQAAPAAPGGLEVTEAVAEQCCKAAKANASLYSVHQLLKVYRAACHYSDSEHETDIALQITSSRAFNRIMLFTLREADGLLRCILGNSNGADDKATDVTRLPRWRKAEPLAKSYLGNTLHILGNMTNAGMQAFILRRLRASAVFLRPFEKLTRKLLKAALQLFGTADDRAVRVQAILFIRQTAIVLPQPALDMCLKGVVRTFSANAKFSSPSTAAHLGFMATCIVELFGLDQEASYAHAFTAVKDLAVTLRGALSMKTADAFRAVYCWQTVRCMELWARVLSEHVHTGLRALVYPLAQVLLGAARLVPAPRYFPLRLRLARALQRLAVAADVLVPLSPLLLEMLHWSDLSKAPQAATGQPPDMQTALRVGKSALRTSAFQEEVVTQVLQLLAEHLAHWSCSVAFPELAHLSTVQLRSLAKALPAERFRTQVKALVAAIDRNSAFVGCARDAVSFSPKDLVSAHAFLAKEREARKAPMQQYGDLLTARLQQRQAMRAAEAVPLAAGRAPEGDDDSEFDDDDEQQPSSQQQTKAAAASKRRHASQNDEANPYEVHLADEDRLHELSDDDDEFAGIMAAAAAAAGFEQRSHVTSNSDNGSEEAEPPAARQRRRSKPRKSSSEAGARGKRKSGGSSKDSGG